MARQLLLFFSFLFFLSPQKSKRVQGPTTKIKTQVSSSMTKLLGLFVVAAKIHCYPPVD
jgi:hypothetical protein